MAFPTVEGTTGATNESANATSHTPTLPTVSGGVLQNDILVAFYGKDGAGTASWHADWTEIIDVIDDASACSLHAAYYRVPSDGTTPTVTNAITTTASERGSIRTYCLRGCHTSTAPEVASLRSSGSGTVPDPPSLTASWGAEDNLWIALNAHDDLDTTTAYPTNFTLIQEQSVSSGTGSGGVGVAMRQLNNATQDPGTFTISATEEWIGHTVVFRPAPSGTNAPAGAATATGTANQPYVAAVRNSSGTGTAPQPEATVAPKPGLGFFRPSGADAISTPDHTDFAVTDIDVTVRVALDDWIPAAVTSLISQSGIIADIGWSLAVRDDGHLGIGWSSDGTIGAHFDQHTTNPLGFTDGTAHTLRATLDVNDGAGNRVVTFYIDGVLLESFTVGGTTSVNNSTQPLRVSHPNLPIAGRVYTAELLSGIDGTTVANPNFDTPDSPTQVTDSTGKVWTVSGSGTITTGVPAATGTAPRATAHVRALAGAATATGEAPQPTVSTGTSSTNAPAGLAAGSGTANPAAATVAPLPVAATGTGTANTATADIDVKPAAPIAIGTANIAAAYVAPRSAAATGTGTTNAGTADIDTKPNVATGAGAADGQTVETGSFVNAPAGLAVATGTANPASTTIRPNAAVGLVAGVANSPAAHVRPNAGVGSSTGTAGQATVTTGRLAPAGLAASIGTANGPKIDLHISAGLAGGAAEAFPVFGLTGNPLGPPQPVGAVSDDDHSLTTRDPVGLVAVDDRHSLEV